MGVVKVNKEIDPNAISCSESFKVKLSLAAEPDIMTNPADIVLVLDRSGSMKGEAMKSLKEGADKFIDIIDEATDGEKDGKIGYGSRVAVVSFADTASQDVPLTDSVSDLRLAVEKLTADGRTNHADAFRKAIELLASSVNDKIIVIFTDGETTVGENPAPIAEAAKAQGIEIYCIGLSGSGGIDEQALRSWASEPESEHVAITPDEAELEKLFEEIAESITKPGATNILVEEKVTDCFKISAVSAPTKGEAKITGERSLQWKIDKLGEKKREEAFLEFTVEHVGKCSGRVKVNESITYRDDEGHMVKFPEREIDIECDVSVSPEKCPDPIDVVIKGCEDAVIFDAGDLNMQSLGRIAEINVKIKNVCPKRRVALAAVMNEVDDKGNEHKRGLKTITVPAHNMSSCRDVIVRCIKFVLPEDLDVSGGKEGAICNRRNFKLRLIAHYIDNDFECCK